MVDVKEALTRKIGPLPAWGWAVAIGGSVIAYRVISGRGAFPAKASDTSNQVGGTPVPVGTSPGDALAGISASDLSTLSGALLPYLPPGPAGPAGPAGPQGKPGAAAPASTPTKPPASTPAPAPTASFAGTKTPFGTVYPSYVKTYTDALAFIQRALRNGYKPITSINISRTPVR